MHESGRHPTLFVALCECPARIIAEGEKVIQSRAETVSGYLK
jgi:hypothetical protein